MEQYWDCSLCRIVDKGKAFRCRTCCGKLRGRDRLLLEIGYHRKTRKISALLSIFAAGLGQVYAGRWSTGLAFGVLIPLAIGLVAVTWNGFSYGHVFVIAAAFFVLVTAALDALLGPSVREAPCRQTCPARLDIPGYLQLIVDGEYEQGYSLIRTRIPFAGVIGRICPHPCEVQCVRGIDGEPISINAGKRFLADTHREVVRRRAQEGAGVVQLRGGKVSVGVVGAGPAGVACAYYLSVLGAAVTVYESQPVIGGRLASTIPDYRLPPYILDEEVEDLRDRGVVFCTETPVGPDGRLVADLLREHAAVFLAIGAQTSIELEISGAEAFLDFQELLRAAKLSLPVDVGRQVAVVGGGNAAVDVCRTALRLGAEQVHLIYRRSRNEMPARADEVDQAAREGVKFHFLADPVEVRVEGGRPRALVIRKMQLGEPDASGRPRPVPVSGEDWELEVDCVIPALGQQVCGGVLDDPYLAALRRESDGRIWVKPGTQRTSLDRVYAGGDAVSGPATAVQAMAQGRTAALALYAALARDEIRSSWLTDRRLRNPLPAHHETPQAKIREEMPQLSVRARAGNLREVEEGMREPGACREAGRCLQCDREL
jgi:NADPH-dependent glutamate synthase beta subunit-like oxidoreductase